MPGTIAQLVDRITSAGSSQTTQQLTAVLGLKEREVLNAGDAGVRAGSLVRVETGNPRLVKYGLPGAA